MQMHGQAPGEVQGRTRELRATVNLIGNQKVMRHVSKNFVPQMSELLTEAGFGGKFTIRVDRYAKGTPHTKGLRIKSPSKLGLDITWHEGSNDNCIAMCVLVPHPLDRMSFHSKLKAAQAGLNARDEAEEEVLAGPPGLIVMAPHVPAILPDLTPKPLVVLAELQSFVETADNTRERFVEDPERVELFMMEIVDSASPGGWVPTSVCSKVIQSTGYPTKGVSSVFRSLVGAGHLDKVPTMKRGVEGFRITKTWLDKLRPPQAAVEERVVPIVPPAAPRVQAVVPETAPSLASPRTNGSHAPSKLLKHIPASEQIKHLSAIAEKVSRHRARQAELNAELESIDQLIALQSMRRKKILEDLVKVDTYLSQPDVTEAEAKFAQVSAILQS